MNWTKYIPEAAGLTFIVAVIVSTLRGFRRPPAEPEESEETDDDDGDDGEDIEQARSAAFRLESERYQAIVSELSDCPERWPAWVRQHHQAKAAELLSGSDAVALRAQMLWDSGQELRGLLAVDDANRMLRRAREMLAEAEG